MLEKKNQGKTWQKFTLYWSKATGQNKKSFLTLKKITELQELTKT
jgi:hypothetical protein